MSMLLAIDIGNTNINFGVFRGNRIIKRFLIPTRDYHLKSLKSGLGKLDLEDALISSVVPPALRPLKDDLTRILGKSPYIIGKEIKVPIKNLYRRPSQVGSDRLVNAYAGIRLFGAPLIVVDFGTAITFDAISRNKEYLGGLILPGLNISLEALNRGTALLPKVRLEKPKEFIGKDTKSSMLSGIVNGFAALIEGLTKDIKAQIGREALVIGTGGDIDFFKGQFDKIDRDLTLKGLNFIYKNFLDSAAHCRRIKENFH